MIQANRRAVQYHEDYRPTWELDVAGDHKEVHHERLYLKEPGTERLRKSAAARLRHLLATGWRETERWHADHYITVKVERSGVSPTLGKMPRIVPSTPPPRRDFRGRDGGGRPQR